MSKIHIEKPTVHIHIGAPAPAGIPSLGLAFVKACLASQGEDDHATAAAAADSAPADRPAIGEYWPGQGGIYAGDMRGDDGTVYGLIVADCSDAQDVGRAKWGPEGEHDLSQWDGLANTGALGDTHPAAKLAGGHTADEHQDFYLPARRELQLAAANVPHIFGADDWYWSSTPRTESYAWAVDFEDGDTLTCSRLLEFRVRPFRRFIY
jgi:hypothetical protein